VAGVDPVWRLGDIARVECADEAIRNRAHVVGVSYDGVVREYLLDILAD
jgi:hypothetical protein